jgi:hypothetical protein
VLRSRLAASLLLAALVAACGGSGPSSGATTGSPDVISPAPSSAEPSEPPSDEPTAGPTAPPTDEPTEPPATEPPTDEPSPSPGTGGAGACTGTDGNREFYALVAAAVDWPVYCAVLPAGWFVGTGFYRLANGGKLVISYKGPHGATLALSEGAFCPDTSGCVPDGTDAGEASFGDREATLVALDDGGFSIVADRGANPSWLAVVDGLGQADAVELAAALHLVEG